MPGHGRRGRAAAAAVVAALAGAAGLPPPAGADATGVGCRGEDGQPVGWWAAVKLNNGMDYVIIDSEHRSAGLRDPERGRTLADPGNGNALAETLRQVYGDGVGVGEAPRSRPSAEGYVLFNDQDPDGKMSDAHAHAKGVIAFSARGVEGGGSGFWLGHSAPKFPGFQKHGYAGYPDYASRYGQSFLCLSFTSLEHLDEAVRAQLWNNPQVYDAAVPAALADRLPNTAALAGGLPEPPAESVHFDVSVGLPESRYDSEDFTVFAKSRHWGRFLYEEAVEPFYAEGFLWETWMNGVNPDETFCAGDKEGHKYDSVNIRRVDPGDGRGFKETQDHSKWGVSQGKHKKVVCIGDINRQQHQNIRGGGTVCKEDPDMWAAFHGLIKEADPCPKYM